MPTRRFIQCDVFSAVPARGNGLAVVVDAEGLSARDMQAFAAWTNLAETTFLLPPEDSRADYKVRIFTPLREMPFAGHPTLGSCMAWLHSGGQAGADGRVRQECTIGLVEIDVSGAVPSFAAPPTRVAPLPDARCCEILAVTGIAPDRVVATAALANGPEWQVLRLASADDVLAADATRVRYPEFRGIGLIGPHEPGGEVDWEVRMLGASSGMAEDPITGSLNAALARWMVETGQWTGPQIVAQGTAIGREGRVHVRLDGSEVWIGGAVSILISGTLVL